MYYRDIETDPREAKAHNERQARNAADRLKKVADRKKFKKSGKVS